MRCCVAVVIIGTLVAGLDPDDDLGNFFADFDDVDLLDIDPFADPPIPRTDPTTTELPPERLALRDSSNEPTLAMSYAVGTPKSRKKKRQTRSVDGTLSGDDEGCPVSCDGNDSVTLPAKKVRSSDSVLVPDRTSTVSSGPMPEWKASAYRCLEENPDAFVDELIFMMQARGSNATGVQLRIFHTCFVRHTVMPVWLHEVMVTHQASLPVRFSEVKKAVRKHYAVRFRKNKPIALTQRIQDWYQYCIDPLMEDPDSRPCYLDTTETPAVMRLSTEQKRAMVRSLLRSTREVPSSTPPSGSPDSLGTTGGVPPTVPTTTGLPIEPTHPELPSVEEGLAASLSWKIAALECLEEAPEATELELLSLVQARGIVATGFQLKMLRTCFARRTAVPVWLHELLVRHQAWVSRPIKEVVERVTYYCKLARQRIPVALAQRIQDWYLYCIAPLIQSPYSRPCYPDASARPAVMRLSTQQKRAMIRSMLVTNSDEGASSIAPVEETRAETTLDIHEVTTTTESSVDVSDDREVTLLDIVRPSGRFTALPATANSAVVGTSPPPISREMFTVITHLYVNPFMPLSDFLHRIREISPHLDEELAMILRMNIQQRMYTYTWVHEFIVANEAAFREGRAGSLQAEASELAASHGYSADPGWDDAVTFWYLMCVQPLLAGAKEPPCEPKRLIGGQPIMRLTVNQSRVVLMNLLKHGWS